MFCCKTFSPGTHVDVTFTHTSQASLQTNHNTYPVARAFHETVTSQRRKKLLIRVQTIDPNSEIPQSYLTTVYDAQQPLSFTDCTTQISNQHPGIRHTSHPHMCPCTGHSCFFVSILCMQFYFHYTSVIFCIILYADIISGSTLRS